MAHSETTPIMIYTRVSIKLSAALSHTQTRRIYFIYFMCDKILNGILYGENGWGATSCPWLWRFSAKSSQLCNKIRKMHTRPFSYRPRAQSIMHTS